MIWPLRALMGPMVWAVAFVTIYGAHGLGCAWGWAVTLGPIGTLHQTVLIGIWLVSILLAALILRASERAASIEATLVRIGGWIGLIATLVTLFPVLGLSSCEIG